MAMARRGRTFVIVFAVISAVVVGAGGWAARDVFREWLLLRRLETGAQDEQRAAAAELVEMGSRRAVPALVRRLRQAANETFRGTSTLLLDIREFDRKRSRAGRPGLVFLPATAPVEGRFWISMSLLSLGPSGVAALVELLGDDHAAVGETASFMLRFAPQEYARDIARVLLEEDAPARDRAADALRFMRERRAPAFENIVRALSEGDVSERRVLAAGLLAEWNETSGDGVGALIGALRDARPEVRAAALRSLASFGPRASRTVHAVSGSLEDTRPEIRYRAAYALGRIGVNASPALTKLRELVRSDPSREVIDAARTAIERITGDYD